MTEAELDERLSRPTPGAIEVLRRLPGDLLVLGAGGKMGPSLCRMARRALDAGGLPGRVIAVSRFGEPGVAAALAREGIIVLQADLLDRDALAGLPDAPNILFLAGQKFGTRDAPHRTWAMNAIAPARVAERYAGRRTVVFSTGNVYPLYPADSRGPTEADPVGPVGEYAMSCLARERIFEHASRTRGLPVIILRLNYAVDLRYGVLVDIAQRVRTGNPVPLTMGSANVIWQGDANGWALRSLALASSPATVLNLTGPERLRVRETALWFGQRFGRAPEFEGREAADALLSDASRALALFGPPRIGLATLMEWVASWIERGGRLLERPTRFEVRDGGF